MTTLYKILKLQVGESESATGRKQKEMRDIGVVLKHSANGNEWQSIKLNAELLPPVLYQLVKPYMRKGCSSVDITLSDPPLRKKLADEALNAVPAADAPDADWADPDQA